MFTDEIKEFIENATRAVTVNEVISYLIPFDRIRDEDSRNFYIRIICREIDTLIDKELINYFMLGSIEYLER